MRNKLNLFFLFLFLFFTVVSCKKEYDPEENEIKVIRKADSLVKLGYQKYHEGDLQGAIDLGSQAIGVKPGYSRGNVLIGDVQVKIKNYPDAIESYTIAIDNPDSMQSYEFEKVYRERAFAKKELKDYQGALADYSKLIELFGSGFAYYQRGILKYDFLDDSDGACSDWSIAGEKGDSRAYDLINRFCNN